MNTSEIIHAQLEELNVYRAIELAGYLYRPVNVPNGLHVGISKGSSAKVIEIEYDRGADLYNVRITDAFGKEFAAQKGLFVEDLADFTCEHLKIENFIIS